MPYDLFLLQETHVSCKERADCIAKKWRVNCFWSFGVGRSAGVAIFVSPRFAGTVSRFLFDTDGRVLSVLVQLGNTTLNIVNIYAPNTVSDRQIFLENLDLYFLSSSRVIAGDFNCVDNALDRLNPSGDFSADKSFQAFLSDLSLVDVWRKNNPRGVSYTWSNSSQASRLDRFLVSRNLLKLVSLNKTFPCSFSDHDFVFLELDLAGLCAFKSSIWKFNTALLLDSDFKQLMSDVFEEQKRRIDNYDSYGAWWENLKAVIKQTSCIEFGIRKRNVLSRERTSLTKRIIRAKNNFSSGDASASAEIKELESALLSLVTKEAEGAKIRSRAQWLEEGEKPSRFFFRLEQKRAVKNSFESLLDENGVEKTSLSDIELILVNFYKDLYTKDSLDMQIQTELIDDLELSLTDLERDKCEGLFTNKELLTALKGLQTGKSPGSDGLPTEFYLAFWDDLGDQVVLVLNEGFHLGVLTDTQRESLLRLLYKKDDKRLAKNWRPISLLNTNYKIASKAITERLKSVMSLIVHQDQTCGVVGRTIFSNLSLA